MTTSVNARIDFEAPHGLCDGNPVKVSRSMPALLSGHMSSLEWNSFCDRLDEALQPLATVQKVNLARTIFTLLSFVGTFIYVFAFIARRNGPNVLHAWVFFLVPFLVVLFGAIPATIYVHSKRNKVRTSIQRVCEDESTRKPTLSFHVRFEAYVFRNSNNSSGYSEAVYNYIEVNVATLGATTTANLPVASAVPASAPVFYPSGTSGGTKGVKTSGERLVELENLKYHLTAAEYEQKRAEILDQI